MDLPLTYERLIAKKRIPGLLVAIASADNQAVTKDGDTATAAKERALRLRDTLRHLLQIVGELAPPSEPPQPEGAKPLETDSTTPPEVADNAPVDGAGDHMDAAPPTKKRGARPNSSNGLGTRDTADHGRPRAPSVRVRRREGQPGTVQP